jgi:hypothetical protein
MAQVSIKQTTIQGAHGGAPWPEQVKGFKIFFDGIRADKI